MTESELPSGWERKRVVDVAEVALGKMLDKGKRTNGTQLPYLRNANVRWGEFDVSNVLMMPFEEHELERYAVRRGDLFVCEGGEPGRSAIWREGDATMKYQKALLRVRPNEATLPEWIMFALRHAALSGEIEQYFTGSTIKHFTREAVLRFTIPVPPLNVQRRIITRVETLLAEVKNANERLNDVPVVLKRFRQSVLAAACSGQLTSEWRGDRDLSNVDTVLAEVAERRQALIKGPRRHRMLSQPEPLFDVPKQWRWGTLGMIADVVGGLAKGQKRKAGAKVRDVPYLRVANVQRGFLDLSEMKEIPATDSEIDELRLARGDVLFTEGGDRDKLGRGWVWSNEIAECIHQNHIFRARLYTNAIDPRFVSWFGNQYGPDYFDAEASQTVNLASINISKLSALPVPIAPREEQQEIARRVTELFAVADVVETRLRSAIACAGKLPQTILARAFAGELIGTPEVGVACEDGHPDV